jgi:hypothetical protein
MKVPLPMLAAAAALAFGASRPADIPFQKHMLDAGANESCAIADINGDGRPDIVSGENWYEAPKWTKHRFRELGFANNYIDNFSDLPLDVNGDGKIDIVSVSWFARHIVWFENPGKTGASWKEHEGQNQWNVEFAFLVDLDNDGKAQEILPQFAGKGSVTAWYEAKGGKLVEHIVSPESYGHGIGAGDVNGDGRADILTPKGWLEAPADPRSGNWKMHAEWDADKQPGFMHVLDINGDGKNDILYGNAHDYGIYWMENLGGGKWKRNLIDDTWSQGHASTLIDLNGDGKKDFLTGKRYMAHDHDPGARDPLGIYWYEYLVSPQTKKVEWVRHVIDYSSQAGAGMQIAVQDIDKDGDLDFATGGKSGVYLFENLTKKPAK